MNRILSFFHGQSTRQTVRLWAALVAIAGLTLGLVLISASSIQTASLLQTEPVSQSISQPLALRRGADVAKEMKLGDRGSQVQALHHQLEQIGYDMTGLSNQFGPRTEQAVLNFQQSAGIGIDGIVGPETQRALERQSPSFAVSDSEANSRTVPNADFMPPDLQRIMERGKLIVAVLEKDNPPFFMTDAEGVLFGSDVALAEQLAEQLGVELEFDRTAQTFDAVVDRVYHHEADIAISKLSRTLGRARRVRFSQPYLNMRQGLLVNRVQFTEKAKGKNMPEMLRTLEGKIGVIRGTSYSGFAQQKFPQATVVEYSSWSQAIAAVTQGKIVAAYRDELEVKKIVRNNPDASLQFQTIALTDAQDPLAVVLPWDSSHLNRFVDLYLEGFYSHLTVDGLLDDYLAHL